MSIDKDLLDELMKGRSAGDLFGKDGVLAALTKALAERALAAELDDHLTEERAEPPAEGASQAPNRRNGSSQKTVTTDSGKVVLDRPRCIPACGWFRLLPERRDYRVRQNERRARHRNRG
ncbi:Transposase (plasmid) [Marinovum algicola DG 898]|nr:Transposase [Marinovum algicola DG 898]